jgi:hypothetical protein
VHVSDIQPEPTSSAAPAQPEEEDGPEARNLLWAYFSLIDHETAATAKHAQTMAELAREAHQERELELRRHAEAKVHLGALVELLARSKTDLIQAAREAGVVFDLNFPPNVQVEARDATEAVAAFVKAVGEAKVLLDCARIAREDEAEQARLARERLEVVERAEVERRARHRDLVWTLTSSCSLVATLMATIVLVAGQLTLLPLAALTIGLTATSAALVTYAYPARAASIAATCIGGWDRAGTAPSALGLVQGVVFRPTRRLARDPSQAGVVLLMQGWLLAAWLLALPVVLLALLGLASVAVLMAYGRGYDEEQSAGVSSLMHRSFEILISWARRLSA